MSINASDKLMAQGMLTTQCMLGVWTLWTAW